MPTAIETDLGRVVRSSPGHRVSVRRKWREPWEEIPYLYCERATTTAAPAIGEALLTYRYGQAIQPDQQTFADYQPLALDGQFVRIEIDQPAGADGPPPESIFWYGVVLETADDRHGARDNGDGTRTLSGEQTFVCAELAYLLTQHAVRTSVVTGAAGQEYRIGRAIDFNAGPGAGRESGLTIRGNMSPVAGTSSPVFAHSLVAAETWSGYAIVQYLLAHHGPTDAWGDQPIAWSLDDASQVDFLVFSTPTLEAHGKSVKTLLDQLIDRRRLCSYRLDVDPDSETVSLFVFSFNSDPIELSEAVLEANPNQRTVDFDFLVDVERASVRTSSTHRVGQVTAVGARRGACFTIRASDLNGACLVADWAAGQQAEYNAAATAFTAGLEEWNKRLRNGEFRWADRLQRVFQWYRLRNDGYTVGPLSHIGLSQTWSEGGAWPGWATGGGGTERVVFPDLTDYAEHGEDAFSIPLWFAGLRFERYLPLLESHDYKGDKILTGAVTNNGPATARPEYLRPLVWIQTEYDELTAAIKYQLVDQLDKANTELVSETGAGRDWACHVRMQEETPGLIVTPCGRPPHYLAKTDSAGLADDDHAPARLDWRQELLATVYMLGDEHVSATWPAEPPEETLDGEILTTLWIDVGDSARLDYVAPYTIVDCQDGDLTYSYGGFVRDDRPRLADLARVAYEWYSRPRNPLELTYRQITAAFQLGDLITSIGGDDQTTEVQCVVTSIEWDVAGGRTRIKTEFAELDAGMLSGIRPRSRR